MDIIFTIFKEIAKYAFVPIGQEAGYLVFYERSLKKLADCVKEVEVASVRMNDRVEEELGNGDDKKTEPDVANWLEKVEKLLVEANELQNDPHDENVGCSGSFSFPNLIWRHQLSRKAAKIAKEMGEVLDAKSKLSNPLCYTCKEEVTSSSSSAIRIGKQFETRELLKEKILKALKDPNSRNVGLYGLGGVGKTTLVEDIVELVKQKNLFDAVAIVRVSKDPVIKDIQGKIATDLGFSFNNETGIASRAILLKKKIIKSKKTILIILDDIWDRLELSEVGIPSGGAGGDGDEHNNNGCKCKMLVTSRFKDKLVQMDIQNQNIFLLEPMNEEDSWILFKSMNEDVVEDISLQDVAKQVANRCGGIPLGIVTVARAMRQKDINAWNDGLRKLENCGPVNIYSALEFSYNELESDETREVFLLMAVLPGDIEEYYLKVAFGLEIFQHINTVDDARNRLQSIIGSLKESCFLREEYASGRLQMHDIVRDVAIFIAGRDNHVFMVKPKAEFLQWPPNTISRTSCSQIVLYHCRIKELPPRFNCPKVRLFLLSTANPSFEIPDTVFEGMESLQVLDLTNLQLPSLPTSFCSLVGLHTLCLEFCNLGNMEAIKALQNLKILSFRKSSMTKLPCEIGKLSQLRMLDLSHSGIQVIPPNIISNLTKLEELKMGNTSITWENGNSAENASLDELRQLSNLTALELQVRDASILPSVLKLMFEKLKRYKIVIGDVWVWSDIDDGILKTLMLKLSTDISLEHGIVALIRGVEKLYLDEVEGIQNVLYQMHRDGFPLLKHLHIQNNTNMKHIIDTTTKRNLEQLVSFPKLEKLELLNLENLEQISHGPPAVNSFGKLSVIKVNNCVKLKYLFSFSMVKGLSQLSEIEVCQCKYLKKIVHRGNDSSVDDDISNTKVEFPSLRSLTLEHLETLANIFSYDEFTSSRTEEVYHTAENGVSVPLFSVEVAFPNLDMLKLSSLKLNKIWDDNQHSFDNLSSLIVDNCGDLKYLFSSMIVQSFKNLKLLEISNCHLMEEIIAMEETDKDTIALEEVRFSKLEKVILKDMKNLKQIWHHQFENLKLLQVIKCEKIVVIFPSSMQKSYKNLEKLEVINCALVEEIFELTSSDPGVRTHMKEVTLEKLSKLKKIWSQDPEGSLGFGNLENIHIHGCGSLEYLFPLSIASCCTNLMELCIKNCGNMKEIVAEKKESKGTTPRFEFNQLNALYLVDLHKLKGFYVGNHILECESLRDICILNCEKLVPYRTLSPSSPERFRDGRLTQQAPFIVEQVIPKLESLQLSQRDADMISQAQNIGVLFTKLLFLSVDGYNNDDASFPYWFLHNVHNLDYLAVQWSSFKKIFQDERPISKKIRLKQLILHQLPNLQHICEEGFRIDPVLEVLEFLGVRYCHSLKNLLPSFVTFSHLKKLHIENCNGMIHLITSSTAQSLDNLTIITVKNCDSIEEIIKGEPNVDIEFTSLQILMLESLPSLSKFCSGNCFLEFPILEKVVLRECPRMKIFFEGNTSTPILRKVKIANDDEKTHWKGNLNDTVKNIFEDKVAFHSFKHLKLYEYPELKESWYNKLHCNVFKSLKHLVVHKCDFLSDVLFQSNLLELLMNLEELDIEDCESLEAVFDLKGESAGKNLVESSTQLKKLTLSNLPKLRHVWKEDLCNTMRFQNLCEVSVMKCKSLLNIFPLSLCQDLGHLEMLNIESCGVEEIVGMTEQSMESVIFNFSRLTKLRLCRLTKLKSFYPKKHSLECSALKTLNVYRCEALRMFSFNYSDFQPPKPINDDIQDMPSGQALFSLEMLISNLEELAINATDALRVVKGSRQENVYRNIKFLRLQCFDETPSNFMNDFHAIFPSLEIFQVRNSSFETLFPTKGTSSHPPSLHVSKPIQKLWLYKLEMLKYIWQEDFPLNHPLLQDLEELNVHDCQSLISLAPSWSSFTNLTSLKVYDCKELVYLITSSTAKSLVKLTKLEINNCEKMLDVVKIDEENRDIKFENLEYLEFTSLSSLRSFCNGKHTFMFPSLLRFVVKGCPQMKIFSLGVTIAPYLILIEVEDKKKRWKGDLNLTIQQLFREQVSWAPRAQQGQGISQGSYSANRGSEEGYMNRRHG